jgi:hypothetical protein
VDPTRIAQATWDRNHKDKVSKDRNPKGQTLVTSLDRTRVDRVANRDNLANKAAEDLNRDLSQADLTRAVLQVQKKTWIRM